MSTTIIGPLPADAARDGEWENQCARCGSSLTWEHCDSCDEYGMDGHDCGEDSCCCEYPEENVTCRICGGAGGWWICLSHGAYCTEHPLSMDRLGVASGTPEWFRARRAGGGR